MRFMINFHGGIWNIKRKCNISTGLIKKYFISIYTLFLDKKGSYIGYNSNFKDIPCFPHGIRGIFISGEATIGTNCVIFQQVTIGSNTLQDSSRKGSPTIGDNCYIGAGAKIIGNITIGNNVRIGANCVVTNNVPNNSVVVLDKPRIIIKENMNNKFYRKNNNELEYFENGKWIKQNSSH
nr:DapH/DapD/GlmU-related protein [Clostridium sp. YIM B02551]